MLHVLCSSLHMEVKELPFKVSDDFAAAHQVVAVLSGGSEALFIQLVKDRKIDLAQPVYLMVGDYSNSLAASMEILSYIRQHNGEAKIMQ